MSIKLKDLLDKEQLSVYDACDLLQQIKDMTEFGCISKIPQQLYQDLNDVMTEARTIAQKMNAIYKETAEQFEASEDGYIELCDKTKKRKDELNYLNKELSEANMHLRSTYSSTIDVINMIKSISDRDLEHVKAIAERLK